MSSQREAKANSSPLETNVLPMQAAGAPIGNGNATRSGIGLLNLFSVHGVQGREGVSPYDETPTMLASAVSPQAEETPHLGTGIVDWKAGGWNAGDADLEARRTGQKHNNGGTLDNPHPIRFGRDETAIIATATCMITHSHGEWFGPTGVFKQGAAEPETNERKQTWAMFLGGGGINPFFPVGGASAGYTWSTDPKQSGYGGQINNSIGPFGPFAALGPKFGSVKMPAVGGALGYYDYMGGRVFNFWIQNVGGMYVGEHGFLRFEAFVKIKDLPFGLALKCGGGFGADDPAFEGFTDGFFTLLDRVVAPAQLIGARIKDNRGAEVPQRGPGELLDAAIEKAGGGQAAGERRR